MRIANVMECGISAIDSEPPVAERTIRGMIGRTQQDVVSEIMWLRDDILYAFLFIGRKFNEHRWNHNLQNVYHPEAGPIRTAKNEPPESPEGIQKSSPPKVPTLVKDKGQINERCGADGKCANEESFSWFVQHLDP